jgi:hypothetical protein
MRATRFSFVRDLDSTKIAEIIPLLLSRLGIKIAILAKQSLPK